MSHSDTPRAARAQDRAAFNTTAILQIVVQHVLRDPDLRDAIADYLRDDAAAFKRQVANEIRLTDE